jgi:NADPH-dependent glutamate synthase beta subunit-like oxidoreductase
MPVPGRAPAGKEVNDEPYKEVVGVEFETDVVVGRTVTIDELMGEEGVDAVYIGTGAGLPQFMNIPRRAFQRRLFRQRIPDSHQLDEGLQFPTYDELMLDLQGKAVAAIGGGNTALDAIRTALRLGTRKAYVIYRRSDAEMPARAEEVHHARQEGIDFQMLTAPVEFISDGKGWLTAARCVRMELGEPDASGRRGPVSIQGSEFDLPLSVAVIAIGTSPPNSAKHHTWLGHQQARIHSGQRGNPGHYTQRNICRRRHCDRQRNRDSRHGRRLGAPLNPSTNI